MRSEIKMPAALSGMTRQEARAIKTGIPEVEAMAMCRRISPALAAALAKRLSKLHQREIIRLIKGE